MSDDLLNIINNPEQLKDLSFGQLQQLAHQLRQYIIDIVSINPGHLGASLGTVELAVALHYVFNTPDDKLIWDVGHQAYAHKILTGRKEDFKNNRKLGGISGFPKMDESDFDSFGTGHASTSISALLGMAAAAKLDNNNERQHIAVIGDGSMTGGQAFEGLNNASVSDTNMLIIFNDNGISIDQNVGGLKEAFVGVAASKPFNRLRNFVWKALGGGTKYGGNLRNLIRQLNNALKGSVLKKSNFFEALRFRYFGPVDGHDLQRLIKLFQVLKEIPGPKVLHIITTKGKGLKQAEEYQTKYHSPGVFDKKTGLIIETDLKDLPPKYQDVFGETLLELARKDKQIVGITPAMPTGSSLNIMMKELPERVYDVGIAEAHAVTFAAGLATDGKIPFCNIYSTFMQRSYDQVIHDVALQKLPVIFCLDRAGLVGEDGPTHHGVYDLAYFNCIPNLIIASPLNEKELRHLMFTAKNHRSGPFVIRYPRGRAIHLDWKVDFQQLKIGKGEMLLKGSDIAILALGHVGNFALEAIQELDGDGDHIALYNMRFLKPMDEELLHSVFQTFKSIITVEDGCIIGGLGSTINDFKNNHQYDAQVINLGVPDQFIEHGPVEKLHEICGFDSKGILKTINKLRS